MLELLVSVPLYAFEKCSKGHLLFVAESLLLPCEHLIHLSVDFRSLRYLPQFALVLESFGLFELLCGDEDVDLFLHVHELLRQLHLTLELTPDSFL